MSELRDKIRAATLGAKKQFKRKLVKVGDAEIEVRQPSLKERGEIAKLTQGKTPANEGELIAEGIIRLCYVPETNEPAFDRADKADIMEFPAGGMFDGLIAAVNEMFLVKAEDVQKNSESLQTDSSSS
jgi:hypothetical protein